MCMWWPGRRDPGPAGRKVHPVWLWCVRCNHPPALQHFAREQVLPFGITCGVQQAAWPLGSGGGLVCPRPAASVLLLRWVPTRTLGVRVAWGRLRSSLACAWVLQVCASCSSAAAAPTSGCCSALWSPPTPWSCCTSRLLCSTRGARRSRPAGLLRHHCCTGRYGTFLSSCIPVPAVGGVVLCCTGVPPQPAGNSCHVVGQGSQAHRLNRHQAGRHAERHARIAVSITSWVWCGCWGRRRCVTVDACAVRTNPQVEGEPNVRLCWQDWLGCAAYTG